jgi:hypothetical protein
MHSTKSVPPLHPEQLAVHELPHRTPLHASDPPLEEASPPPLDEASPPLDEASLPDELPPDELPPDELPPDELPPDESAPDELPPEELLPSLPCTEPSPASSVTEASAAPS